MCEAQGTTKYWLSQVRTHWFSGRYPVAQEACAVEGLGNYQVMTDAGIRSRAPGGLMDEGPGPL